MTQIKPLLPLCRNKKRLISIPLMPISLFIMQLIYRLMTTLPEAITTLEALTSRTK